MINTTRQSIYFHITWIPLRKNTFWISYLWMYHADANDAFNIQWSWWNITQNKQTFLQYNPTMIALTFAIHLLYVSLGNISLRSFPQTLLLILTQTHVIKGPLHHEAIMISIHKREYADAILLNHAIIYVVVFFLKVYQSHIALEIYDKITQISMHTPKD